MFLFAGGFVVGAIFAVVCMLMLFGVLFGPCGYDESAENRCEQCNEPLTAGSEHTCMT